LKLIIILQPINPSTMNTNEQTPEWGFYSTDGFFQPVSSLNSKHLEYVSKSSAELEVMLQEEILKERYEQCAIIRDELLKRRGK
jgi:hypothetical protein